MTSIIEYQWSDPDSERRRDSCVDKYSAYNAQKRTDITSESRHQLSIDGVHVLTESVDNTTDRSRIKEGHGSMHDVLEQNCVNLYQKISRNGVSDNTKGLYSQRQLLQITLTFLEARSPSIMMKISLRKIAKTLNMLMAPYMVRKYT